MTGPEVQGQDLPFFDPSFLLTFPKQPSQAQSRCHDHTPLSQIQNQDPERCCQSHRLSWDQRSDLDKQSFRIFFCPNIWEVEVGRPRVKVELEVHSKFEAGLGYKKSCLKPSTPGLLVLGMLLGGKAPCTYNIHSQV